MINLRLPPYTKRKDLRLKWLIATEHVLYEFRPLLLALVATYAIVYANSTYMLYSGFMLASCALGITHLRLRKRGFIRIRYK